MQFVSTSTEETLGFAHDYAADLHGGEVLAVSGDLGMGKTVFAQGLAAALGVRDNVNSPTYVIMKVYNVHQHPVIKHFVHIDSYRLNSSQELEDIGALDYFKAKDCVTLIEWPEKIADIIPITAKKISFQEEDYKRLIEY